MFGVGQCNEGAGGFRDELVNVGPITISQMFIHCRPDIFHRFIFCDNMIFKLDALIMTGHPCHAGQVSRHAFGSEYDELSLCGVYRVKIEPPVNFVQPFPKCLSADEFDFFFICLDQSCALGAMSNVYLAWPREQGHISLTKDTLNFQNIWRIVGNSVVHKFHNAV